MGYQAKSQTVGAVPDLKIEQAPQQLLVILAAAQLRLGRSSAAQAIAKRLHDLAAPAGE